MIPCNGKLKDSIIQAVCQDQKVKFIKRFKFYHLSVGKSVRILENGQEICQWFCLGLPITFVRTGHPGKNQQERAA